MSRTKGALGKDKSIVRAKFRKAKFDALDEMILVAQKHKENEDWNALFDCCKELIQYAYPKLRSVELALDEDTQTALSIVGTTGLPKVADQPTSQATDDAGVTRH